MEISRSDMNWGSDSNTLDNSNVMFGADCDVASLGYYQRLLLLDEDMIPPHSDDAQVDYATVLQNQDDVEQLDCERAPELNADPSQQLQSWERLSFDEDMIPPHSDDAQVGYATVLQNQDDVDWERAPELNADPSLQLQSWEWLSSDEDMIPPHSNDAQVGYATVLQKQDDVDWERAPELNADPSQQLQSWEPAQLLNWEPSQELLCPSTSETIPEFPTIDQSEHTNESGEEDVSEEEDQSTECDGECSYNRIDESTGGLTLLPKLPSGKKIGVSYHKKNKQWEAHLWIKGPQLRGRKKKGVQIFLGNFETEEQAKVAHDRAAIKLEMQPNARGELYPLNFPAAVHASYIEEHAQWTTRDFLWKIRRTSKKFSKGKSTLKGVSVRTQSVKRSQEGVAKYESRLSLTAKESGVDMKRTFFLGNFESEEEAGQAYDRALLFLNKHMPEVEQLRCITNYRPSTYSTSDIESMASKLPSFQ